MASADYAAIYAALILADDGIEITSDKILAVTSAASVDLEPIWASLVAKALEGKNVKELLVEVGAGSTATLVVDGVPADAAGPDIEEPPLTQQQKEEEESDDDIGFGLFD